MGIHLFSFGKKSRSSQLKKSVSLQPPRVKNRKTKKVAAIISERAKGFAECCLIQPPGKFADDKRKQNSGACHQTFERGEKKRGRGREYSKPVWIRMSSDFSRPNINPISYNPSLRSTKWNWYTSVFFPRSLSVNLRCTPRATYPGRRPSISLDKQPWTGARKI